MVAFLADLRSKITIGFVGGSDLKKQQEQLAARQRSQGQEGALALSPGYSTYRISKISNISNIKQQDVYEIFFIDRKTGALKCLR